jgi:hypothetical protein
MIAVDPGFADRIVSRTQVPLDPPPPAMEIIWFRRVVVTALGTANDKVRVVGPVQLGDLLMTSDIPGCACAAPEGTDARYILAKAWSENGDGEGFVRATLMAG